MTNDELNGQDKIDEPETSESFEELTNRLKVGDAITLMERQTEELDDTGGGGTTRIKSYAFARTSWKDRVLRWFRR